LTCRTKRNLTPKAAEAQRFIVPTAWHLTYFSSGFSTGSQVAASPADIAERQSNTETPVNRKIAIAISTLTFIV
jgi:hypothetical protein